jgi:polyketide biosynthesis 3-hydroxy-3-methylglutaryl-CoA synthase-like enzyme PksG
VSPLADARALVIASDVPRLDGESPHGEPTVGAGAVAVLVGGAPALAVAELGASGYHSFDVGDYFRPTPTHSVLDTDLSLLAYVQGLKNCRADYARRRPDIDFLRDFDHLAFHVPVPAVVKGAHRSLSRDLGVRTAREVTDDFRTRLEPSLRYPSEVGNIWAASTLLALASVLDNAKTVPGQRLGIYSYGSGCSAEFCSYLVGPGAPAATGIDESLLARTEVDIETYERLVTETGELYSGLADHLPDLTDLRRFAAAFPQPVVALAGIRDHVRDYVTVGAAT